MGDSGRQWYVPHKCLLVRYLSLGRSYLEGVSRGFFTKDPGSFNDPNVCEGFLSQLAF